MLQKDNKLWQTALAVNAALVLAFSAVAYGQSNRSGAASTESSSSSGRETRGPSGLDELNQQVIQEFRANQGKVDGRYAKVPLLLLTTTGAKSGRALTRPLAYTRDGERLVVIASFGGGPKNPPWYYNLVAHPEATVEVGSERFRVRATVATGAERQRLYNRQAEQLPAFAEYEKKTKRQIPVIVLTRID
jgi:deazaflavin-dependent oxidoreductase (nitroreductase family)